MEPISWFDAATLAAILLGPILAVAVDRIQRRWSDTKQRRLMIFRDLMRTRKARLDADHVGALNLIDLEFYGCKKVLGAFREYIVHLSSPMPSPEFQDRYFEHREDLLNELLFAIGAVLGYKYDKRDLERLSYGPIGWNNDQNMQRHNMALLNDLLTGKRALPVTAIQPTSQNPFPPAPMTAQATVPQRTDPA